MRKALGIAIYVLAGFFLYTAGMLAFFQVPALVLKVFLLGPFVLLAGLAMWGGGAVRGVPTWGRDVGVVLTTAAIGTAVLALTVIVLLRDPLFMEFFPDLKRDFFSDYAAGSVYILILLVTGRRLNKQDRA